MNANVRIPLVEDRAISDGFVAAGSICQAIHAPGGGYTAEAVLVEELSGREIQRWNSLEVVGSTNPVVASEPGSYKYSVDIAFRGDRMPVTITFVPPAPLQPRTITHTGSLGDIARANFRFAVR
jgi:hypothetical protein